MLLKVNATSSSRSEIVELAQIFRARVVDVAEDALTLEVVGDPWSPLCRCCKIWSAQLPVPAKSPSTSVRCEYRVAQVPEAKVLASAPQNAFLLHLKERSLLCLSRFRDPQRSKLSRKFSPKACYTRHYGVLAALLLL